jgi:hypothetical protein
MRIAMSRKMMGVSAVVVLLAVFGVAYALEAGLIPGLNGNGKSPLSIVELGLSQPPTNGSAILTIGVTNSGSSTISGLSATTSAGELLNGTFVPATLGPGETSYLTGAIGGGCALDQVYSVTVTADGYVLSTTVTCFGEGALH